MGWSQNEKYSILVSSLDPLHVTRVYWVILLFVLQCNVYWPASIILLTIFPIHSLQSDSAHNTFLIGSCTTLMENCTKNNRFTHSNFSTLLIHFRNLSYHYFKNSVHIIFKCVNLVLFALFSKNDVRTYQKSYSFGIYHRLQS